jgi:hypothetical protein
MRGGFPNLVRWIRHGNVPDGCTALPPPRTKQPSGSRLRLNVSIGTRRAKCRPFMAQVQHQQDNVIKVLCNIPGIRTGLIKHPTDGTLQRATSFLRSASFSREVEQRASGKGVSGKPIRFPSLSKWDRLSVFPSRGGGGLENCRCWSVGDLSTDKIMSHDPRAIRPTSF